MVSVLNSGVKGKWSEDCLGGTEKFTPPPSHLLSLIHPVEILKKWVPNLFRKNKRGGERWLTFAFHMVCPRHGNHLITVSKVTKP